MLILFLKLGGCLENNSNSNNNINDNIEFSEWLIEIDNDITNVYYNITNLPIDNETFPSFESYQALTTAFKSIINIRRNQIDTYNLSGELNQVRNNYKAFLVNTSLAIDFILYAAQHNSTPELLELISYYFGVADIHRANTFNLYYQIYPIEKEN